MIITVRVTDVINYLRACAPVGPMGLILVVIALMLWAFPGMACIVWGLEKSVFGGAMAHSSWVQCMFPLLTKQVNMFMRLFRSDDKFSQMLNQFESQPEYGGGSGSGGCGDDEPGDDEDGGEDEDDS
ncbi:hypothetical protein Tco_0852954 [Tanacetum coccineum]